MTPTPLLKGLFTVVVLSVAGAAGYHLYQAREDAAPPVVANGAPVEQYSSTRPATSPAVVTAPVAKESAPVSKKGSGAIGTPGNPLKVSLVSFHGYAPALVANGNSLTTAAGSIFDRNGVSVTLMIQDDIPTLSTLFESKAAHCAWRTSDFWAQEQPNLRNSGHDGRAVMAVDNTQGADAILTAKANINSVEDLAGHSIGLLQFTPSHGMTIDAIDNSAMSAKKKESVRFVYVNADEGTGGVRALYESGKVDAVALWDPDLMLAHRAVKGSKIVYSTKTANNLIYDVIVCDKRVLDSQEGHAAIQNFVAGWMEGVTAAKANPDNAVKALIATEETFTLLAKQEGNAFIKSLFSNLVWTDVEQNARIFGLNGQSGHYARVYKRFDEIYRAAGALANPKSPVINPQDSVDTRFIQKLLDKNEAAKAAMVKPEFKFSEAEQVKVTQQAPAVVTKLITVNFATGSSELSKKAQLTIDREMVPFIENNGSAYFEIAGNTDSVGSAEVNQRISVQRAQAVAKYLTTQWEMPASRFKVVGYGSSRPLCPENNPAAEGLDLEGCRAMNRSTRLAVFGR